MDDNQKRGKALVDKRWEPAIGIIQYRQGRKQKIVMMIPQGQEIQPGDIVWLDNVPGDRMPDGSLIPGTECEAAQAEPEDTGGDAAQTR